MEYEIRVSTEGYIGHSDNKELYVNDLLLALCRLSYSPYLTEQGDVAFSIYSDSEITKINEEAVDRELMKKNIL